jgi:hypothetical protein
MVRQYPSFGVRGSEPRSPLLEAWEMRKKTDCTRDQRDFILGLQMVKRKGQYSGGQEKS